MGSMGVDEGIGTQVILWGRTKPGASALTLRKELLPTQKTEDVLE
jgi:hypothetical protein